MACCIWPDGEMAPHSYVIAQWTVPYFTESLCTQIGGRV